MQTPDANGFVNVTWPSKNVPHGGIFHSHAVNSSTEQRQFLKVLIEESRLDTKLRHGKEYKLRRDESSRSAGTEELVSAVGPRPCTSRRRSQSSIRHAELMDEDSYRPIKKGDDREKLKDNLAYVMANGDAPCQVVPAPLAGQRLKPKANEKKLPSEKQKWNELVTQIRERAEWLAEMEYLGEGAAHREIINEQIAERMRALDALGVDSQCSTARSIGSGFSTIRSKDDSIQTRQAKTRQASGRSNASQASKNSIHSDAIKKNARKGPVIEHVSAYNKLSPLGYSPRRRQ